MKYLKLFNTTIQYDQFKSGSDYITPNVSYVEELAHLPAGDPRKSVMFSPHVEPPTPISLCDIAYWDGSAVKTVSQDKWSTDLGTPVGVVVIPEGFAPDGKARMISLKYATSAGTSSNSYVWMRWGGYGTDTSLTNYTKVPTTDNVGSTSNGSSSNGYLPSDKFTGATSFVDSTAKYFGTSNLIPSPYLGDDKTFNPEYSKEISGNNALSDFNGASNTAVLVGLGTGYTAANAAHNYNGGVTGTNIQWYLPAMGELGFLMPRFNAINAAITAVGGVAVTGGDRFWSSSEYSSSNAHRVDTYDGRVYYTNKNDTNVVRPWAIVE